jgi:hypothetical protein
MYAYLITWKCYFSVTLFELIFMYIIRMSSFPRVLNFLELKLGHGLRKDRPVCNYICSVDVLEVEHMIHDHATFVGYIGSNNAHICLG